MVVVLCTSSYDAYGNTCMKFYEHILNGFEVIEQTRSSQRDCELTFFVGQGFAELQLLKKWKWPYLLNCEDYCGESLHTHWYWQDLANEIVEWHLGLDRGIAKSSPRNCKMIFYIGRGCAELQILKKWKWPNWVDYCDKTLHIHWYWQDVAPDIVKCHLRFSKALPRFKFWKTVKLALSLEAFLIFW